eukprot:TRINITY_DN8072_c0_g1_i1.p1 TRINITY_DN8072_c0_g1~~TRINITY_DN8072_c0_g1_i1.p1  ORF type:complete len:209 (-),score=43.11 TRINITY_DN8072_c0_g1_i1:98-724(-)
MGCFSSKRKYTAYNYYNDDESKYEPPVFTNENSANDRYSKVLILGLENSGKTTIFSTLNISSTEDGLLGNSAGFSLERGVYDPFYLIGWDVGSNKDHKIRALWRMYYQDIDGLVFVIDCSDTERLEEAIQELKSLLNESELKNVCLLVFANKQDKPGAISSKKIEEKLKAHIPSNITWNVQGSSSSIKMGFEDGFIWLKKVLSEKTNS